MVPITDVILEDLGPRPVDVLRVVAPMLGRGYAAVALSVRHGPVLLCSGKGLEVATLVHWLRECGARVTWVTQVVGPSVPNTESLSWPPEVNENEDPGSD